MVREYGNGIIKINAGKLGISVVCSISAVKISVRTAPGKPATPLFNPRISCTKPCQTDYCFIYLHLAYNTTIDTNQETLSLLLQPVKIVGSAEVSAPKKEWKQPIEVEYNLPTRFNPNKRRFRPNTEKAKARQKKKAKLNLVQSIIDYFRKKED
ncbi:hypothetical protein BDB01DRAFT_840394 [Pilobolus umbonatus]|nr:hypothetical protein BDB01DRAFT_840394 [Pilobolus umbonatus]